MSARLRLGPAATSACLLMLILMLTLMLTACSVLAGPEPDPSPTPTPLAELETSQLQIPRAEFCEQVPESAVTGALGAPVTEHEAYASGDEATLAPKVRDVAHEYSCSWSAATGVTAQAWVFAPPMTRGQALAVVRDLENQAGCSVPPDAAPFGRPSIGRLCTPRPQAQAGYAGLFGDAWLSCTVTDSRLDGSTPRRRLDDLVQRADRWCSGVVTAVGTS